MSSKTFAAGLFVVVSLPICAAIALGAYLAADWVLGKSVSRHDPVVVLISGVLGMWAVVLFGLLVEESERIASRFSWSKLREAGRPTA